MGRFSLLNLMRFVPRHGLLLLLIPSIFVAAMYYITRNDSDTYTSKARVYTGITSGTTIELNETKTDFKATNTAYDNLLNLIKSRSTIEAVAIKLLAQHMSLDSVHERIISKDKYAKLMDEVPDTVKALVVIGDPETTYQNLVRLKESDHTNYIYQLLNLDHTDYSIKEILKRIRVMRVSSSDFVDVEFEGDDPAICQNTLLILCNLFIKLNAEIKVNQSDTVVKYFEGELADATIHLDDAENELLEFNQRHSIINFYEQTKHIASEREGFEMEYQRIYMTNVGADAVLKNLSRKLDAQKSKLLSSIELVKLKDELAEVNFQISMKSITVDKRNTKYDNFQEVSKLKEKSLSLKERLASHINNIQILDHTEDNIEVAKLLEDWLESTIVFESSKAQLKAMDIKRLEFDKLYQLFAPLGATMKRLERKINIAEQEYLSLLHSLGLAKLRQQNAELKTNLKLIDKPYFPIKPQPSKRMTFIILAGIMGLVLVVSSILILEYLDTSLKTTENAQEKIGLKVSSIYPVIADQNKKIDYESLEDTGTNAMSRNIILAESKRERRSAPFVTLIFSTQENEGKTYLSEKLAHKFCQLGYKTLHISYDGDLAVRGDPCYRKIKYVIRDTLSKVSSIKDFDQHRAIGDFNQFDHIILELPGIINHPFPVKWASMVDQSFMVARANRMWSVADKNAIQLFTEANNGPEPMVILNGVKPLEMETVVGELPRKRSRLRIWVKNALLLRLNNKTSIA